MQESAETIAQIMRSSNSALGMPDIPKLTEPPTNTNAVLQEELITFLAITQGITKTWARAIVSGLFNKMAYELVVNKRPVRMHNIGVVKPKLLENGRVKLTLSNPARDPESAPINGAKCVCGELL